MSDFFKSALGYFNPGQNGGIGGPADDDFVGQIVEVGTVKLHVKRLIAEGGFAYVYVVQDVQSHTEYALKRLMGSDKQACNNIIREINLHKQLSGHPNIVRYVAASFIDRTNGGAQGNAEYLLVSELCKGGSLADCLSGADIEPETVLRLAYQATQALRHLHGQSVPVTHRDIKIENFLLGADGHLKLCDFGSATTDTFHPTASWTAAQRDTLEDQLASCTTPMYRAPEHLDLWSNHAIGPKADVWALGCVIYCLCYRRHPFEDSAKLRIVNANYTPLPSDGRYSCFQDVIRGCFHVDPGRRFDVATVLDRLAAIAETKGWQLKGELRLSGKPIATPPMECGTPTTLASNSPTHTSHQHSSESSSLAPRVASTAHQQQQQHPQRPPPPTSAATFHVPTPSPLPTRPAPPQHHAPENQYPHPSHASAAAPAGSLFSSLRGGAGSFLRNLKDTSSKVMQTVQQTMTRTDLDISAITSRVLVMPVPSEGLESTYKVNNIDDVRMWLESRYAPAKLSVYNLGARTAARLPPPVRTVDAGSVYGCGAAVPTLAGMYSLAEDMFGYLCADAAGTLCVQSSDQGRAQAATMVCALFIYAGLVHEPEDAMQIFAVRRQPPNLRPSEVRYLYYLGDLVRSVPHWPHSKPLALGSITCTPVPRMTKARDGCRMYAEVACGDRVVLTTELEYEHMRLYQAHEGSVTIDLNNVLVCGDFVVTLYHTRNALKGMGRPQAIRVCQFQMHSGFVAEQETLIRLERSELDEVPDVEHVPNGFVVSVPIAVGGQDRPMAAPWKPFKQQPDAQVLFGTLLEYEENVDNFVTKLPPKKAPPPTRPSAPPVQRPVDVQQQQQQHHSQPPARPSPPQPSRPPPMRAAQPADEAILDLSSSPEPQHQSLPQSAQPQPQQQQPFVKEPSFDLLGEFQSAPSQPTQSVPDLLSNTRPTGTGLDDLFGSLPPPQHSVSAASDLNLHFGDFAGPPIAPLASSASHSTLFESLDPTFNAANKPLTPMSTSTTTAATAAHSSAASMQSSTAPKDPFADLGNLSAGLGSGWLPTTATASSSASTNGGSNGQRPPPPPMMTSPMATQFSSPTHHQQHASPRPPSTPNHQPSAAATADYSRSHFDNNGAKAAASAAATASAAGATAGGGTATGFGGDIFGDILGQQGYNFASKSTFSSPRSINEMRKEELVRDMDPDKLKLMEWTEGKKNNIRALLCSMHTVLWTDAKWQKCEMHTLVSSADVKKAYRKACLAVHPDKQMGTDNEVMSKMIFIELNNAWTDFENDATQQSVFS